MIYEGTIEDEVIDILSKRYEVKVVDDEDIELEDETHFCLEIIGEDVKLSDIQKLVGVLSTRVIRYGQLYAFSV